MSNDSNEPVSSTKFIMLAVCCIILFIIACISVLSAQSYDKKYNAPVSTVMMEDLNIDISTYTLSTQTIILEKGSPKLSYVYSGIYDSKYIIQGIKQGYHEQTFFPIYVEVGDTLNFSWEYLFSKYDPSPTTRRRVDFSESWSYKITEITNQQVTLERFKLISREWK